MPIIVDSVWTVEVNAKKDITTTIYNDDGTLFSLAGATITFEGKNFKDSTDTKSITGDISGLSSGQVKFPSYTGGNSIVTSVADYEGDIKIVNGSNQQFITGIILRVVKTALVTLVESYYCDPQDVGDLINLQVTDVTKPSTTQIMKLIKGHTKDIENRTKHAFRTQTITNELHDLEGAWQFGRGIEISLMHRQIATFDYSKGDRIQYWDGANWLDVLSASSVLPDGVVVHYELGVLDFRTYSFSWTTTKRFRITYRYGETLPDDIRLACAKWCAMDIITGGIFWSKLPVGGDRATYGDMVRQWKEDIEDTIYSHQEIIPIY